MIFNINKLKFSVANPDPGSGIEDLFDPWIRDTGWRQFGSGMEKKSDPGSGINIPDPQHC